jgi:hypothetical protein
VFITICSQVFRSSPIRTFFTEKNPLFPYKSYSKATLYPNEERRLNLETKFVIFSTRMSRVPTGRKQSKALSPPRSRSRTSPRVVETSPVRFEQHFTDSSDIDPTFYAGPKTAPHPSNVPLPPAHWLTFSQPINDLTVMTLHLRQILKVQA